MITEKYLIKKPKMICIGNHKGGVGKTLISFNLLGYLASQGKKVLGIDCDPQANLSYNCRFTREELRDYYTVGDIFEAHLREEDINPEEIVVKGRLTELPSLDLIPSNTDLTKTEMRLVSSSDRILVFTNYIENHPEFFNEYDYIIFDLSPSFSNVNQSALYCTDDFVIVSDTDMNSFEGVRTIIDEWGKIAKKFKISDKIKGVIVNKYDKRVGLSNDFIEFIKANMDLKDITFNTILPMNSKLAESGVIKTPIVKYYPKGKGYELFIELMEELKEFEVI